MSQLILDIKNLTVNFRVYGGYLKVLNEVNFSVAQGEKVGLSAKPVAEKLPP